MVKRSKKKAPKNSPQNKSGSDSKESTSVTKSHVHSGEGKADWNEFGEEGGGALGAGERPSKGIERPESKERDSGILGEPS